MSVGAIGGSNPYTNIATGQRINSAANDPSGLAIAKGMEAQISSANKNVDNAATASNVAKTADGALESIQGSLQRLKELATQANNGIMTAGDKKNIQVEVDALKSQIQQTASTTEFNQMKLLDGSFNNKNIALNTNGTGSTFSIANTSLDSLGIKGFDVTKGFDMKVLDKAMEKVSTARSNVGSATNAFEYATNSINGKIANITSSMSKIKDADIAQEASNLKKSQILEQYKIQTQRLNMNSMYQQSGMNADFKL